MWDAGAVEDAELKMNAVCITQPLIFYCQDQYWLKADNTAIPLLSASAFTDCIEALLQFMFMFSFEYPHEFRLTYGLRFLRAPDRNESHCWLQFTN